MVQPSQNQHALLKINKTSALTASINHSPVSFKWILHFISNIRICCQAGVSVSAKKEIPKLFPKCMKVSFLLYTAGKTEKIYC